MENAGISGSLPAGKIRSYEKSDGGELISKNSLCAIKDKVSKMSFRKNGDGCEKK